MKRDAFYVGYLPLPGPLRRFVLLLVPVLLAAGVVVAVVTSSQQNDPGNGVWDLAEKTTITGVLRTEPYPVVETKDGWVFLIGMGKSGVDGLELSRERGGVQVAGYAIGRGQTLLLTVESLDDIQPGDSALPLPDAQASVTTTLTGQIIDPKCYFGAMKPGEGKVHKACATLCIAGGIPPMFMTTDPAGQKAYYLLVDQRGGGIRGEALKELLPFVADPVRITGQAERWGGLQVLKVDPGAFERR